MEEFLRRDVEELPEDHFTLSEDECPICREATVFPESGGSDSVSRNVDRRVIKIQSCNHIYHAYCLRKWLASLSQNSEGICPLDRSVLYTEFTRPIDSHAVNATVAFEQDGGMAERLTTLLNQEDLWFPFPLVPTDTLAEEIAEDVRRVVIRDRGIDWWDSLMSDWYDFRASEVRLPPIRNTHHHTPPTRPPFTHQPSHTSRPALSSSRRTSFMGQRSRRGHPGHNFSRWAAGGR
ncbi:hypothetical protein P154DRAFT_533366 [Amniculicola lignicola CBS 123094]|uniref:RING-type domain-containing protein n=1 Tax=Amniculicola lignicola CBS 123094 TaxID=1392246 RepID=A0A6A5WWV8_9PLEO|nr:hypothetical protein P154DRAFT_533366 [Amniculicola lignicola CBS 123094]